MTVLDSLNLARLVLLAGLAVWMLLVSSNNIRTFKGGRMFTGSVMNMTAFDQEPAIRSPLLVRRTDNPKLHSAAFLLVVVLEFATSIALVAAAVGFGLSLLGVVNGDTAIVVTNIAVTGLFVFAFAMMIGGSWFAYYIRMEMMQVTHMALLILAVVTALFVNIAIPG